MAAGAARSIRLLGWRDNRDELDVALAVNRLLARGAPAWWSCAASEAAEAGDFLVALTPAEEAALAQLGLRTSAWAGEAPSQARALRRPVACLFAGTASKFPYYAYDALALLRVGVDYRPCDGAALASGILEGANLLVLPGGFATWGIDAAEGAPGADARVRDFLAHGGTAIGSCGGAYYLSAGRPGWTGTAAAKPLYTHEYLQSGVGIVTVRMAPGPLGFGLPPTVEMPYYHGPVYDVLGPGIEVAATFHALCLPGRLAIDNPLDAQRFARDLAGKPAILVAAGARGRAVLFSPHPEMGDLVRKYVALDGYVRHYLPIRGYDTMRDTLRHYRVTDAPSFRMLANAVHLLMTQARAGVEQGAAGSTGAAIELAAPFRRALAALPSPAGEGDEAALLRGVASDIAQRLDRALSEADGMAGERACAHLAPPLEHLVATFSAHLAAGMPRPAVQSLMELDLAVGVLECWTRVARFDRALAAR